MEARSSLDPGAKWTDLEVNAYEYGHQKEDTISQAVVGIKKMVSSLGHAFSIRRPSRDGRESRESQSSRDSGRDSTCESNLASSSGTSTEASRFSAIGIAAAGGVDGEFKVPELPGRRRAGSKGNTGLKSLAKVFKKKKRKDNDMRRTNSQQDLSTPDKEAARFDLELISKPHSASLEDLRSGTRTSSFAHHF